MQRRRGFTLIEVMIVILIISVLISIALPQMMTARESSRRKTCQSNMRIYDVVKSQWAMFENIQPGTAPSLADLEPYLKNVPVCPGGGTYDLGTIDTVTVCSVASHNP